MKAIILAAGEGTRLRPHTLDRPKCLVEIDGSSLIDRQLAVLRYCGIDEIVIIGGYRAEALRDKASRLYVNPRYAETNMVWTLFCAEEELTGEVILSYGDIVYCGEILDRLMASNEDISVAIDVEWESYWRSRSENPLEDAETLRLATDGRILELGQRPRTLSEIQGQYMGLMKLTPTGVAAMRSVFWSSRFDESETGITRESAYMTDLLQSVIDSGHRVEAVLVSGPWVEVDTVADLQSEVTRKRLSQVETSILGAPPRGGGRSTAIMESQGGSV